MNSMPVWYQQGRSALLLLQSVIGLLLVSYPMKRRSHFYPRLILSVPDEEQAQAIANRWQSASQKVYSLVMDELLEDQ